MVNGWMDGWMVGWLVHYKGEMKKKKDLFCTFRRSGSGSAHNLPRRASEHIFFVGGGLFPRAAERLGKGFRSGEHAVHLGHLGHVPLRDISVEL